VFVEIRSFRSGKDPAGELRAFREAATGASVQMVDSSAVAGRTHLLLTLKQTVELKDSSQLLADTAEMDFLLRVAGTKQISAAVAVAGSKPGADSVLVVFGSEDSVRRGVEAISELADLKLFRQVKVGRRAASRIRPKERGSVIDGHEVESLLLAERAALLRR
jgi:tRNA threonylcarbamoyladenosine modification (KEOPS) complex Cgi121 subunit